MAINEKLIRPKDPHEYDSDSTEGSKEAKKSDRFGPGPPLLCTLAQAQRCVHVTGAMTCWRNLILPVDASSVLAHTTHTRTHRPDTLAIDSDALKSGEPLAVGVVRGHRKVVP
jgi:hypothetical protein